MKASELKNTPFNVEFIDNNPDTGEGGQWAVSDNEGTFIAFTDDEPTAKAIAALPDTLARLERLEGAAQAILNNWESGDGTIRVSELMNNLKKALEE